jgi:Helix-turn-helix domain
MREESLLTLSVPAAGKKYFGLSRNGAYDAAARGDLPTIRIGRLLRVPVRALERMLDRASEPAACPTHHQPIEPVPGQ